MPAFTIRRNLPSTCMSQHDTGGCIIAALTGVRRPWTMQYRHTAMRKWQVTFAKRPIEHRASVWPPRDVLL